MSIVTKVILSLSVSCFIIVGLISLSGSTKVYGERESKKDATLQSESGLDRINKKAKAAKDADKDLVQELTTEVLSQYGWQDAPAGTKEDLKDRIVRNEIKFHKGQGKGISELQVSRVINGLVTKFKTPDYTKTSPSEVREVRGRLIAYMPDFIGRGRVAGGKVIAKKAKSTIEEMSPVEAVYITLAVMHQKIYNPEFHLTQQERKALWVEKHKNKASSAPELQPQPGAGQPTARQTETKEALGRAYSAMTLDELTAMPGKALDALGIDR